MSRQGRGFIIRGKGGKNHFPDVESESSSTPLSTEALVLRQERFKASSTPGSNVLIVKHGPRISLVLSEERLA